MMIETERVAAPRRTSPFLAYVSKECMSSLRHGGYVATASSPCQIAAVSLSEDDCIQSLP